MSKNKEQSPTPESLSDEELEQVAAGGTVDAQLKLRVSADLTLGRRETGIRKKGVREVGIRATGVRDPGLRKR